MPIETTATPAATIASRTMAMSLSASNQCATGPKGPLVALSPRLDQAGRARPRSGWMMGGPDRGTRGAWGGDRDRGALRVGRVPAASAALSRSAIVLCVAQKASAGFHGMLAECAVRSARNADGWAADGPRQSANAQVQSALFRCSAAP
jgi:hypothetical protein